MTAGSGRSAGATTSGTDTVPADRSGASPPAGRGGQELAEVGRRRGHAGVRRGPRPYRVVRCTRGRPSGATSAASSSTPMPLAVAGPGGPGDVLVHQRAAQVVGPGPEQLAGPGSTPIFTQLTWMLSMAPR